MNKDKILSGVVLATLLMATPLCAANGTWTGSGDGTSWFNSGNWQGGTVPGIASGSGNTDYATITPGGINPIAITFDTLNLRRIDSPAGAGALTYTGTTFRLTGHHTGTAIARIFRNVTTANTTPALANGNYSTTINANLILEAGSASGLQLFSLDNRAPNGAATDNPSGNQMVLNGNVSGGATALHVQLQLGGTNSDANTVNGIISDGDAASLQLHKGNNGAWILSGANTYSGGTILNGGGLSLQHNTALGTGLLSISAGSLINSSNAALTFTNNNLVNLSGAFNIVNRSTGDFNLGNGNVTLSSTVTIRSLGAAGRVVIEGNISGGDDDENRFGIIRHEDEGEFVLTGTRSYHGATESRRGTLVLDGAYTGSGDTIVGGGGAIHTGRIHLNHAQALGAAGRLIINTGGAAALDNSSGAALALTTHNKQVWGANFTFTGTHDLDLGNGAVSLGANTGATRTITVDASTLTVGGAISNGTHITTPTVNLSKNGTGTLRLNGTNAYTGTTAVSSGRLLVNGQHLTGGAYSVGSTGVLGGSGAIRTSGITFTSGAKLDPGDLNTPGALTLDLGSSTLAIHNLVVADNSQSLLFTLGSVAGSDQIILSNALSTLDIGTGRLEFNDFVFTTTEDFLGGTFVLFETSNTILGTLGANLTGTIGGLDATLGLSQDGRNVIVTMAAIPEPGTWAMLAAGAGLLLGGSRLRRKLR